MEGTPVDRTCVCVSAGRVYSSVGEPDMRLGYEIGRPTGKTGPDVETALLIGRSGLEVPCPTLITIAQLVRMAGAQYGLLILIEPSQ
jgi:hypothetical protein